jgi:thiamine kinase-like enzyme
MAFTDEVDNVMADLQKSVDANGNIDLALLLAEVVTLFDHLKTTLPKSNPEERQEIVEKMMHLHNFLIKESKRLSDQTGISQDQMVRFAENPDNFTKDQWALLENVRNTLGSRTEEIKVVMQEFAPQSLDEMKTMTNKGKSKRKSRDIKRA